jgi:bifunctional pyridoxal-dependent enzyme with beta-cystathionase and maltose regulon repressor activities
MPNQVTAIATTQKMRMATMSGSRSFALRSLACLVLIVARRRHRADAAAAAIVLPLPQQQVRAGRVGAVVTVASSLLF